MDCKTKLSSDKQDILQSIQGEKQSLHNSDKFPIEDSMDIYQNILQFAPPKLSGRYSFKGNPESFTLGHQSDERETQNSLDTEKQIKDFDFVSLFIDTEYIPCKCKHMRCSLCHDTKLLKVSDIKQQLNTKYQEYFQKNYEKLWSFICDKYGITINNFEQWVILHKQIQYPSEEKKFIFQCDECKIYYKDQIVLFQNGNKNYCEICKLNIINVQFIKLEYKSACNMFMASQYQSEIFPLHGPPSLKKV